MEWVPDGSQIMYSRGAGLYALDVDGSRPRTIVDPEIDPEPIGIIGHSVGVMMHFDVSPDSSRIAYSTCRYPGTSTSSASPYWEYSYEIVVSSSTARMRRG